MYLSILGLGLLIGMQHAFEADHIAAVSAIASRKAGIGAISRHGLAWGLGHTVMLLLVAGTALTLKVTISKGMASVLESAVGLMLIGLGAHLLWRLWRERVHFHVHAHDDGAAHFHAHSHKHETTAHDASAHAHSHVRTCAHNNHQTGTKTNGTDRPVATTSPIVTTSDKRPLLPWRTFAIGLMHGMAGSAALVVIASSSLSTPGAGMAYVLLFGLGSIIGMALLTAVIAVPITFTAKYMTWTNRSLQIAIGCLTIIVGSMVISQAGASVLSVYL